MMQLLEPPKEGKLKFALSDFEWLSEQGFFNDWHVDSRRMRGILCQSIGFIISTQIGSRCTAFQMGKPMPMCKNTVLVRWSRHSSFQIWSFNGGFYDE
jgi:hypothetical protein